MATGTKAVLHDIQTLFDLGAAGAHSDAQLLDQFLALRGAGAEAAFEALVARHGAMVLRVCRRILIDPNDAEDAFQVTFFVLARKARAIARREQLGNWLYGVAVRSAMELRKRVARRRAREEPMQEIDRAGPRLDDDSAEIRSAIDLELSRLPATFRAPVVLCDLEGKTQKEAARILRIPIGTVSSRVSRGRAILRRRLSRRGIELHAGALALPGGDDGAPFTLPPALITSTARAAVRFANAGSAGASIPAHLAAITEGVLKSMLAAKLTSNGLTLLAAMVLSIGTAAVGVAAYEKTLASAAQSDALRQKTREADPWSWIDEIKVADPVTRERLKRCATAATTNFAAIKSLVFDYEALTDSARLDQTDAKTVYLTPRRSHGTVYWKAGSVRYDVTGNFPFRKPAPNGPLFAYKDPKVYSVVRSREMLAYTEENVVYGLVLTVEKPPATVDEWRQASPFIQLKDLDPWLHYATPFLLDQPMLKQFWGHDCSKIESEERNGEVLLRFFRADTGARIEVVCDGAFDWLPVRLRGGDVREGKWLVFADQKTDWKKAGDVWYPNHFIKTAFLGTELRPTTEFEVKIKNARANEAADVPDSRFTLSDMNIPEGTGGLDKRLAPPRSLYRAGGVVRETRPGEGRAPRSVDEAERKLDEETAPWDGKESPDAKPPAAAPTPDADAGASTSRNEYLGLLARYESSQRSAEKAFLNAESDDDRRAAFLESGRLEWSHAGRFLEIALKYPGDPVAIDALGALVAARFTPPEAEQAAQILILNHLQNERLLPVYRQLATPSAEWSTGAERLLRAAAERAPTPEARGQACLSLAFMLSNRARDLRKLRGADPDPLMKLEEIARCGGQEPTPKSDEDPDALAAEAERFFATVADRYAQIKGKKDTLGDTARAELFKLRDLAIGKPAPEIEGSDADGKAFRLSDHRGNVVVLSFSANWCGPCRVMYPHGRALAARMKGRPFILLGVNLDDDKQKLHELLASGEITWRCLCEGGEQRPNSTRWHVNEIPMVYVIDAQGKIRAKDVRGKAIDEVVDRLVRELESRGSKGS